MMSYLMNRYRLSIAAIVEGCPKREGVRYEECIRCPYSRGVEGNWPKLKVKCALRPEKPRKVSLIIPCPLKNKGVNFKTCIKCPLNRGFYGFHNDEPVMYCGLPETRRGILLPIV